jgi:F0F1-type ATP synthase membrane subunit b/b'
MLRQDSSSISPDSRLNNHANPSAPSSYGDNARAGIDIQRELNRLEEMILDSPRFPLTRRTMVDEEQLLDQLELIQLNLPDAFHEAEEIVRQKDDIVIQAKQYAQDIVETAERRVAQILDEMDIIRQAELEAKQVRLRVQQECEAVKEQTLAEIERMRRQAQQELEEMRQLAIVECEEIQNGADEYADHVLKEMEQQLGEMIRVVRNGRQQLQVNPPSTRSRENNSSSTTQRTQQRERTQG